MKRALSLLVGGNIAGQLITVLSTLVIARLYNSSSYGQLAIVMSLSSTIATAAHGRFHLALGSNVTQRRAISIMWVAFLTIAISGLGCCLALGLARALNWSTLDASTVIYSCLIAAGTAAVEVSSYWRSYQGDHAFTAKITVFRAIATPVCQSILCAFGPDGLVVGLTISLYLTIAVALIHEFRHNSPLFSIEFKHNHLIKVARHYIDFPLFSLPQAILTAASFNVVPLIMTGYTSKSIIGQYWLSYRMLLAPVAILGSAYRQVFLTRSGDKEDQGSSSHIARSHTGIASLVLLPGSIIFFFIAPYFFSFAYGDHWRVAGKFAAWLGFVTVTTIAKVPAVSRLQSIRKLRFLLIYEVVTAILKVGVFWYALQEESTIVAVAAYSIVTAFLNLLVIPFGLSSYLERPRGVGGIKVAPKGGRRRAL